MQRIVLIAWARLRPVLRGLRHFVDWRFIAALAVLVLFVAVIRSGVSAADERDRAFDLYESEHRDAVADRAASAKERAALLQGQQEVQAKLDRLIAYMRSQGYEVPDYVLSGSEGNSGGDDSDGDGSGKQSRSKSGPAASLAGGGGSAGSGSTSTERGNSGHGDRSGGGDSKGGGGGGSSGDKPDSKGKSAEHAEPAGNPKHDK